MNSMRIARVHGRALEQAGAIAASAGMFEHRNAELCAFAVLLARGIGKVRHGDQPQAAVVDAEDLVPLEIELLGVAPHLGVARGIAETQVTVGRGEFQQVLGDALAVCRAQRANGHHEGRAAGAGPGGSRAAQHVHARVPRSLEPVFGVGHAGNVGPLCVLSKSFLLQCNKLDGNTKNNKRSNNLDSTSV
jgi:hypothetical protein